jgi:hypothetical protein
MCGELGMIMSASRTVAQRQSRSRARRIVMVRRIAPRRRSVRLHRVAASRGYISSGCNRLHLADRRQPGAPQQQQPICVP